MKNIQAELASYKEEEKYNIDGTGLFWAMLLLRGLATKSMPRAKKSKNELLLLFMLIQRGQIE